VIRGIYANDTAFTFLPNDVIRKVKAENRKTLSGITRWIDDTTYNTSFYKYGLPEHLRSVIDLPIGNLATYSDLLGVLSKYLKKPITYLELGVSVGKNFYQLINLFENTECFGFEIEKINPTLERVLSNYQLIDQWDTGDIIENQLCLENLEIFAGKKLNMEWLSGTCAKENTLRKEPPTFASYKYKKTNNDIFYLSADIFNENSWKRIGYKKFNLIFSDAFHNIESLFFEYAMIEKYGLLDEDEFIFVWDDMGNEMTKAVLRIWESLYTKYKEKVLFQVIPLRGWFGDNEITHQVAVIMKLS